MSSIDYLFLGVSLVGIGVLLAISKSVRIIAFQSLFHPTQTGYLEYADDDVKYVVGPVPTTALHEDSNHAANGDAKSELTALNKQSQSPVRPSDAPVATKTA